MDDTLSLMMRNNEILYHPFSLISFPDLIYFVWVTKGRMRKKKEKEKKGERETFNTSSIISIQLIYPEEFRWIGAIYVPFPWPVIL